MYVRVCTLSVCINIHLLEKLWQIETPLHSPWGEGDESKIFISIL